MYGRVWEAEEIDFLRSQRKLGVPLHETARQLGRSYSAVKSYASDHGILSDSGRSWSDADDACLLVLARSGKGTGEISELMGRSVRAIRQRLVRLNLTLSQLRALGPVAST